MVATLTTEQVLALAPDAAAATAGRVVARPGRWVALGRSGQAVWGEYQGSGRQPYQTRADTGGPAFGCTCPSRKVPCKHALGLLLLAAGDQGLVPETSPPGWVVEWLAARATLAGRRAARPPRAGRAAPDPAGQARRAASRTARVEAGVAELRLLLRDVVRGGLATPRPARFWEEAAARMVDAQAPGLAGRLRRIAALPRSGDRWAERLLEELGRLHLLVEAYRRIDRLPQATRADVRALVGWPQPKDELLAQAGLRDHWGVVARRVDDEDRLRVQRTWLWGGRSGRPALLLDFAPLGQPLRAAGVPGSGLDAELVFYPGSTPVRALVKAEHATRLPFPPVRPGLATAEDAHAVHAAALAANPWTGALPVLLDAVVPVRRGGWVLRDPAGACLPLAPWFGAGWQLAALAGGRPVRVFGEWDGEHLLPLAVLAGGRLVGADRWA
jgi:SWIM zinc finger